MTISLTEIKVYLRLDPADTAEDELLDELIEAATNAAARYVGAMPDPMPADVRVAIRQITGALYEVREGASDVLEGSRGLLAPFREWAF